jgi:hypothetical protein
VVVIGSGFGGFSFVRTFHKQAKKLEKSFPIIAVIINTYQITFTFLLPMESESFNDLSRRSRAAKESISTGYDGMEVASLTTGISRLTIEKEIKEIVEKDYLRDSTGRNEVKENEPG